MPLGRIVLDLVLFSTLLGGLFALVWIYLFVRYIHGNPLEYIFTLGAAFFIYDMMESTGFNGAICVLVFSLALGNYKHILKLLKNVDKLIPVEKDIVMVEGVNHQITFLVRTLFFFFIGLIFNITAVQKEVLIFAVLITVVLLTARFFAGGVLSVIDKRFRPSLPLFTIMAASGFIDTLLAVMVSRAGVNIPYLTEIILLIVIFTTLSSLIGMIILQRHYATRPTF
jgi:cell volume regulation protein A